MTRAMTVDEKPLTSVDIELLLAALPIRFFVEQVVVNCSSTEWKISFVDEHDVIDEDDASAEPESCHSWFVLGQALTFAEAAKRALVTWARLTKDYPALINDDDCEEREPLTDNTGCDV